MLQYGEHVEHENDLLAETVDRFIGINACDFVSN